MAGNGGPLHNRGKLMQVTYFATWKAHGTSYHAKAETMAQLEIKVFGRAYAPQRDQVAFYSTNKETSN
jgi:hypothetical protein